MKDFRDLMREIWEKAERSLPKSSNYLPKDKFEFQREGKSFIWKESMSKEGKGENALHQKMVVRSFRLIKKKGLLRITFERDKRHQKNYRKFRIN